jgi:hypothetical protein
MLVVCCGVWVVRAVGMEKMTVYKFNNNAGAKRPT